jgi:hypothetical protein
MAAPAVTAAQLAVSLTLHPLRSTSIATAVVVVAEAFCSAAFSRQLSGNAIIEVRVWSWPKL